MSRKVAAHAVDDPYQPPFAEEDGEAEDEPQPVSRKHEAFPMWPVVLSGVSLLALYLLLRDGLGDWPAIG